MINRSTKLTALLLAATSIASITPAMAVEKLGNKEGTIKEAVAFDGGKYAYYGYKTDDDDTGIWYNKGTEKDNFIEDLEDYEITKASKYGTKYAYVTEDGNKDDYLVDLSTGKIVDDETAEEKQDTAKAKLISNLKKAERYNNVSDTDNKIKSDDIKERRLFQNQFGDIWYQYATTGSATTSTAVNANGATISNGYFGDGFYTGFFNENGKYIDASYTANMSVYNARKGKATNIEKYGKIYKDEALRVNLISIKALAQDKDYIYALTKVAVDYYGLKAGSTTEYDFDAPSKTIPQTFIQKISKAQGNKQDGAYLPKSVESYQLDNGSLAIYEDAKDSSYDAFDAIDEGTANYSVKDGNLYVTYVSKTNRNGDMTEVTTAKLKLGKAKLDVVNSIAGSKYEDIDTKIVMLVEEGDTDAYDMSIDVDGNTWVIYKGKIKMFDGKEFKDMYSCDRSFDRIDVYNKDSLVAWDENSDAYTTVQEGKNQTVSDATEINPDLVDKNEVATTPAKTGWEQQADGTWVLYDVLGAKVTGWANVGGVWYYMDAAGTMKTGWVNDNGTWYYLQSSGAMKTGWLNDNGTWYYLNGNGSMATGWLNDNGTWYYLNSNGSMAANQYVGNYWLNASGAWVK